jgi:DNA repair exonuclease SbcCD nuclease subunit
MAERLRVLAYADHHFDEHKRFDECVRIHDWCVDLARREKVGLVLSAGDLYERASTPLERREASGHVIAMTELAPMGIAKGNHDKLLDCQLLGRLHTKHPVIVEEAAAVHSIAGAAVALVAWPDRASIAASLRERGGAMPAESVDGAAREAFRAVLLHLANELEGLDFHGDTPRIGCGHFMVDGSVVSTGQPLLGMPLNLGLSDLALLRAPLVVCGHIHKAQEWGFGESRILYPGSPFRTDFGQLEQKSVVLATYEGARLVDVQFVPTPATPMVHLDLTWTRAGAFFLDCGRQLHENELLAIEDGAEVRVRYEVDADQRDAAKAAVRDVVRLLLAQGALSAKDEEVVIPTTRARAPEIAAAPTLVGKLEALARTRGEELPEGVRAKVVTLEEENHAA